MRDASDLWGLWRHELKIRVGVGHPASRTRADPRPVVDPPDIETAPDWPCAKEPGSKNNPAHHNFLSTKDGRTGGGANVAGYPRCVSASTSPDNLSHRPTHRELIIASDVPLEWCRKHQVAQPLWLLSPRNGARVRRIALKDRLMLNPGPRAARRPGRWAEREVNVHITLTTRGCGG